VEEDCFVCNVIYKMNLICKMFCMLLFLTPSIELWAGTDSTPWLGVEVTDVNWNMASNAGLDIAKGAFIKKVYPYSPAQEAGLRPQDIILSFNGRGIRSARELKNDISGTIIGKKYQMCIARAGYRADAYVIPAPVPGWIPVEQKPSGYLGLRVADVEKEGKISGKLQEIGKQGVLVTDVIENSPAERAGIEPGDVIMSFNFRKVRTANEFLNDLSCAEIGKPIRMCIMRGDIRITLYPVPIKISGESKYPVSTERTGGAELISEERYDKGLERSILKEVLFSADLFQRKRMPVPHYVGYDIKGERVGIAFVTTEICPQETWGYQSQISILVGVNLEGTIIGVKILSCDESPQYTRGLCDLFVSQYLNKNIEDYFIIRKDIDAITGATITSSAVNNSIKKGLSIISSIILDERQSAELDVKQSTNEIPAKEGQIDNVFWQYILSQIDFLILFGIVGLAIYGHLRDNQTVRYLTLALSFFYLGILKGGGFSINNFISILHGNFPVIIDNIYWYSLLIIVIFSVILAGRFYCGWLCPFGVFLEFLGNLNRNKISVPCEIDPWLRSIKYQILFIILFIVSVTPISTHAASIIGVIEPFGTFFKLMGSIPAWIFLALVLIFSFFIPRAYCKYLCPLGALLALFTLIFSFIKTAVTGQKFPRHYKKYCPMDAIRYTKVFKELRADNNECIRCSRWE